MIVRDSVQCKPISVVLLTGCLALAACGGGGGGGGGGVLVPATVTVSGIARFEFPPPNAGCRGLNFNAVENRLDKVADEGRNLLRVGMEREEMPHAGAAGARATGRTIREL